MYSGIRGKPFNDLIENLVPPSWHSVVCIPDNFALFSQAFTSSSYNPACNYEMYEQIGDVFLTCFLVSYIYNTEEKLNKSDGSAVRVVSRLRIKYESKQELCKMSRLCGFWPFISATFEERQKGEASLLEDVFEAFLGVLVTIVDRKLGVGEGYKCVYELLCNLYAPHMNITTEYNELCDAKTRLKELYDQVGLGKALTYTRVVENYHEPGTSTSSGVRCVLSILSKQGEVHYLSESTRCNAHDAAHAAAQAALDIYDSGKRLPCLTVSFRKRGGFNNSI